MMPSWCDDDENDNQESGYREGISGSKGTL